VLKTLPDHSLTTSLPPSDIATSPLATLLPALLPFYAPDERSPMRGLSQSLYEALVPCPPLEIPRASTSTERPEGSEEAKAWFRTGLRKDLWGSTATGGRQGGGLSKRLAMADFFAVRPHLDLLPAQRMLISTCFCYCRSATDRSRRSSRCCRTSSSGSSSSSRPSSSSLGSRESRISSCTVRGLTFLRLIFALRADSQRARAADDKRLLTILIHVALTSLLRPSPNAPYRYEDAPLATITGHIFDLSVALGLDLYVNLEVLEGAMTSTELVSDEPGAEDEAGLEKPWDVVSVGERCPACGGAINFDDVEGACCANGHEWGATLFWHFWSRGVA